MSVNKYQEHFLVLPEDDANRQVANGFLLYQPLFTRNIQVLREAGGWTEVLDYFRSDHVDEMRRYPKRLMVLLIDFDNQEDRFERVTAEIPGDLTDRVFILGALSNPEALKTDLGSYETIGVAMARDCHEDTDTTWGHQLLEHNASELERLRKHVRPILFPPN